MALPTGAVGGAEAHQTSWHEAEKSNLMHDTSGAGEQGEREQQEGWAEERRGGGEDTCDCDSECHNIPWSGAGARETCSHNGSKAKEEREVEAEQQSGKVKGDGRWKHGVRVKGAQGVNEVEMGSCACRAMSLGLKSLELKGEPTDERDELQTTLALVRSARAGGL